MITYCKKCLFPHTKPHLEFNGEGVCSACTNYDDRSDIDWEARKAELLAILDRYRQTFTGEGGNWDCLIPVSGGKDSIYQVVKMLELGMNPLCVNVSPCGPTDIGRRNMDVLENLGVDCIEFVTNRAVRKKLNKIGLLTCGDITWAEHAGVFTIPVQIAVNYNIPLIIWGENSQNEYGGPAADANNSTLDHEWLMKHGGLLGLSVDSIVKDHGIEQKNLIPFVYPKQEDIDRVGVTGLFLGHYLPWNGFANFLFSQAYGMESYPWAEEGSFTNSENLDTYYHGVHDYFKFLKLGYGRVTDQVNLAIRRNMLTRKEGVAIVRLREGKFPWSYLGKPLEDMLEEIDVTLDQFIETCDAFTNRDLFVCDGTGDLVKDRHGNLTKVNYDNVG